METKHTPGPWAVGATSCRPDMLFGRKVVFENGPHIGISGPGEGVGTSQEMADAHAHLFAAAPELLEHCRRAYAYLTDADSADDLREIGFTADLGAVIAKATGATP